MGERYSIFVFLITSALVCIMSFVVVGPFNMRVDGHIYTSQVEQFEAGTLALEPLEVALRAFKPFPGVWGSLFVPLLTPVEALQLLNILLIFAFPFAVFFFLKELGFEERTARWGALWVLTGYPVLKYGLAISTDLGAWVSTFVTAALVLRGIRTDSLRTIVLASLIGFIGGTFKETGVIGLVFGGLAILFSLRTQTWGRTLAYTSALVLPALILEIGLLAILVVQGFPTFVEWLSINNTSYAYSITERLIRLGGVELSTFNALWIFAVVGVITCIQKHREWISEYGKYVLAAGFAVSVVVVWPIPISRVVFIESLVVIPLALRGAEAISDRFVGSRKTLYTFLLFGSPIAASVVLLFISKSGSLFQLFS